MNATLLKRLHLVGTLWFMLCVGYLLTLALRQAGFNWWLIFSLSGHSLVIFFLLISVYLFAMFRGGGRSHNIHLEHPLTSTEPYLYFYIGAPFLGTAGGALALDLSRGIMHNCNMITLATFGATLFVWMILDPLLGIFETLTPTSRHYRQQRQEEIRQERRERQIKRDNILAQVADREDTNRRLWSQELESTARELADLLNVDAGRYESAGRRAVELGLIAYRLGGIRCMRLLHEMALDQFQRNHPQRRLSDYIIYWWDGIGPWHSPATE